MDNLKLCKLAIQAKTMAYAPYSHFKVGAALLTKNGKVYLGGNIENMSFGATNCAERTAFFKAISEGEREFSAIAIVGGKEDNISIASPCGICRQVMSEFCNKDFKILLVKDNNLYEEYSLGELLPKAIDLDLK